MPSGDRLNALTNPLLPNLNVPIAPSSLTETNTSVLHSAIAEELAVDIIEGRWKPGDNTTLNTIQERFSISRTVARETAHSLESAHAIIIKKRVGLIAQPLSEWLSLDTQVITWKLHSNQRKQELVALTELRLAVEPFAAAQAALRAPVETRALMPVLAMEMRKNSDAGNLDEFHQLDLRFHNEILQHSGNDLFSSLSSLVDIIITGRTEKGGYQVQPTKELLQAHEDVSEAIWESNPDVARRAMTKIVTEVSAPTNNPNKGSVNNAD